MMKLIHRYFDLAVQPDLEAYYARSRLTIRP